MLEAVIFDMDGLLIDSEPLWHKAEMKVFAPLGIALTPEMCRQTTGVRIDEVVRYWYRRFPWEGRSQADVTADVISEVHRLALEEGSALDGVYSILQLFRNQDYRMALASSSPMKMIEAIVDKLDIRDYFPVLCSAAEEVYGKPHPAVYLSASRLLEVEPQHCLAFEDSFPGLIAAKAADMKVVAVPDSFHRGQPRFNAAELVLDSLSEFTAAHLQALCRS